MPVQKGLEAGDARPLSGASRCTECTLRAGPLVGGELLKKALHGEKPRDHQYIYLAPGSDHNVGKALVTKLLDHLH